MWLLPFFVLNRRRERSQSRFFSQEFLLSPRCLMWKGNSWLDPGISFSLRLSLSRGQIWGSCGEADARVPELRDPKMQLVMLHNLCQAVCTEQMPNIPSQTLKTTERWTREHPMKLSGKNIGQTGGKYFFTQHIIKLWTPNPIVEVPVAGCAGAQADRAPAGISRAPGGQDLAGETSNGWTVPGRRAGVRGELQNPLDWTWTHQFMCRSRRLFCFFHSPGPRIGWNRRKLAWGVPAMASGQFPSQ